jgi:hypothetical protein
MRVGPPPSFLPIMWGGGPSLVLKGEQRSAVRNPARRSTDRGDFWTPLGILYLIKGGGSGNGSSSQRAPCDMCRRPIGSRVPSSTCFLTLRLPWTSPSTEPTCPTRIWVLSPIPLLLRAPGVSAVTPFTHEQPPGNFTPNHKPPRQSSVYAVHHHLPCHPKWPVIH